MHAQARPFPSLAGEAGRDRGLPGGSVGRKEWARHIDRAEVPLLWLAAAAVGAYLLDLLEVWASLGLESAYTWVALGIDLVFVADLIATTAHLPLPWIMGYDVEPLRTLESKRALLNDAVAGGWRLLFEHDPGIVSGTVTVGPKGVVLGDQVSAPGRRWFRSSPFPPTPT